MVGSLRLCKFPAFGQEVERSPTAPQDIDAGLTITASTQETSQLRDPADSGVQVWEGLGRGAGAFTGQDLSLGRGQRGRCGEAGLGSG